jgi:hypothetical protein
MQMYLKNIELDGTLNRAATEKGRQPKLPPSESK